MKEENVRQELARGFWSIGFDPVHFPDFSQYGPGAQVKTGRPDLYLLNPCGGTVFVEVKVFTPGVRTQHFNGKTVSDAQRNALDWWVYEREGHAYLAIGTIEKKRRCWLIPWGQYAIYEQMYGQFLNLYELSDAYILEWSTPLKGWLPLPMHPIMLLPLKTHNLKRTEKISPRTQRYEGTIDADEPS